LRLALPRCARCVASPAVGWNIPRARIRSIICSRSSATYSPSRAHALLEICAAAPASRPPPRPEHGVRSHRYRGCAACARARRGRRHGIAVHQPKAAARV
jgi:hypothetical protein